MSRRIVWVQLLIGWMPAWVLFTALIAAMHGISHTSAAGIALRTVGCAAVLGVVVQRLTERYPWESPPSMRFGAVHIAFALVYSIAWILLNSAVESVLYGGPRITIAPSLSAQLLTGMWIYVMIAGVSYTSLATDRAHRAEADAAIARLAALRAQLNPHFLFNAMHSVVHLIPENPKQAALAAELLASLLRTTIEEDRDIVPLSEELAFVERYLELERMRFDERLMVTVRVTPDARRATIPVFALQTLVENALRHGAAPNIETTTITINGNYANRILTIIVSDNGSGSSAEQVAASNGSGLRRLRERLQAHYDRAGRLDIQTEAGSFRAQLIIPQADVDS